MHLDAFCKLRSALKYLQIWLVVLCISTYAIDMFHHEEAMPCYCTPPPRPSGIVRANKNGLKYQGN
jgi:hypothetical protein